MFSFILVNNNSVYDLLFIFFIFTKYLSLLFIVCVCVQQAEECDGVIAQLAERQGSLTSSLRDKHVHLSDLQNTRVVLTQDLSALQEAKERVSASTNSIRHTLANWTPSGAPAFGGSQLYKPVILWLSQPM